MMFLAQTTLNTLLFQPCWDSPVEILRSDIAQNKCWRREQKQGCGDITSDSQQTWEWHNSQSYVRYFKQARTNLEVDAPLICSITIFCWWKRVLYWEKGGQRCCWWNIRPSISQVSTVFCRPAKAALITAIWFPGGLLSSLYPNLRCRQNQSRKGRPLGSPLNFQRAQHRIVSSSHISLRWDVCGAFWTSDVLA